MFLLNIMKRNGLAVDRSNLIMNNNITFNDENLTGAHMNKKRLLLLKENGAEFKELSNKNNWDFSFSITIKDENIYNTIMDIWENQGDENQVRISCRKRGMIFNSYIESIDDKTFNANNFKLVRKNDDFVFPAVRGQVALGYTKRNRRMKSSDAVAIYSLA
jgi:hypothetical protein